MYIPILCVQHLVGFFEHLVIKVFSSFSVIYCYKELNSYFLLSSSIAFFARGQKAGNLMILHQTFFLQWLLVEHVFFCLIYAVLEATFHFDPFQNQHKHWPGNLPGSTCLECYLSVLLKILHVTLPETCIPIS